MKRILIVGKDERVVEQIKEQHDVIVAEDQDTAEKIIGNFPSFDLVITDLRITEAEGGSVCVVNEDGGIDILEAVKNKDPLTEVIIITTGSLGNLEKAKELGVFTYIDKTTEHFLILLGLSVKRALEFKRKADNEKSVECILKRGIDRVVKSIQMPTVEDDIILKVKQGDSPLGIFFNMSESGIEVMMDTIIKKGVFELI